MEENQSISISNMKKLPKYAWKIKTHRWKSLKGHCNCSPDTAIMRRNDWAGIGNSAFLSAVFCVLWNPCVPMRMHIKINFSIIKSDFDKWINKKILDQSSNVVIL